MQKKRGLQMLTAALAVFALASAAVAAPALPSHPWSTSPVAVGDQIKIFHSAGTTNGGEWVVANAANPSVGLFGTFCLERSQRIRLDTAYTIQGLSDAADKGLPTEDALDSRTAYLYSNYYNGTLSDFNYTDFLEHRADADALQAAIWYLEGEVASLSGQALDWVNEATAAIANGDWTGLGDVRVINLNYLENGQWKYVQDLLTVVGGEPPPNIVPEPTTFAIWALLGGMVGLVYWPRRKRA